MVGAGARGLADGMVGSDGGRGYSWKRQGRGGTCKSRAGL